MAKKAKPKYNKIGFDKLNNILKNLDGHVSKAGWFESNVYESGIPVAYVASIQEFGVPQKNIPSRSFMRTTSQEKKSEWRNLAFKGAKAILKGKETSETVMAKLAMNAVGDVQKKIASIWEPPLSPRTIKARQRRMSDKKTVGSLNKPLIDTGIMFETMNSVVEAK